MGCRTAARLARRRVRPGASARTPGPHCLLTAGVASTRAPARRSGPFMHAGSVGALLSALASVLPPSPAMTPADARRAAQEQPRAAIRDEKTSSSSRLSSVAPVRGRPPIPLRALSRATEFCCYINQITYKMPKSFSDGARYLADTASHLRIRNAPYCAIALFTEV